MVTNLVPNEIHNSLYLSCRHSWVEVQLKPLDNCCLLIAHVSMWLSSKSARLWYNLNLGQLYLNIFFLNFIIALLAQTWMPSDNYSPRNLTNSCFKINYFHWYSLIHIPHDHPHCWYQLLGQQGISQCSYGLPELPSAGESSDGEK